MLITNRESMSALWANRTPTNHEHTYLNFNARANLAPQYLQDLLVEYTPSKNVHSANESLLAIPKFNI